MRSVYLDNGATSYPKAPGVGEAMSDFITKVGCNIARGGYQRAYDAAGRVLEVREKLNRLVNGPGPRNVVFTGGPPPDSICSSRACSGRGTRCSPPPWSTTPSSAPWSS